MLLRRCDARDYNLRIRVSVLSTTSTSVSVSCPRWGGCLFACLWRSFRNCAFCSTKKIDHKPPFPMNYSHEFPPPKNKECLRVLGFEMEWGGEWVLLAFCVTGAVGVICECPCARTTLPGIDCSPTASQGLTNPMLFHRGALSFTVKCAFRCCISLLNPKPWKHRHHLFILLLFWTPQPKASTLSSSFPSLLNPKP